ncbi:MAG: DnaD domain protein [Christensenellaceae bacterium]|jgi:DnaD/phage-associated family protein|nr:DnaD domain protein [Christensenellaceae bacterium]
MAFVSFSSQLILENSTAISNAFIEEHLPTCNGDCARVYLYGLYMCGNAGRYDNTIEHFAKAMNLSEDDITSAFMYLQGQGLVQILSVKPFQVKYLPVKAGSARLKKYEDGKYNDFNIQIQAIIEGRMISKTEYEEYYYFLESLHVQPEALIMIAKYCVDVTKKTNIGYHYILNIAKNWAYAGTKTVEAVEEKLAVQEYDTTEVAKILKILGVKRNAEPSDYQLLEGWRLKGFEEETLHSIATFCKKTDRKKIEDIDDVVEKFYKLGITTPSGIDAYISSMVTRDKAIKEIVSGFGLSRPVANIDRDFYTTWTDTWNFTPEIINYAATLSIDKSSPMAYLNKVLASWFEKKITTLDAAKKSGYTVPAVNMTRHSYSSEQLKSLFANFDEVKIERRN